MWIKLVFIKKYINISNIVLKWPQNFFVQIIYRISQILSSDIHFMNHQPRMVEAQIMNYFYNHNYIIQKVLQLLTIHRFYSKNCLFHLSFYFSSCCNAWNFYITTREWFFLYSQWARKIKQLNIYVFNLFLIQCIYCVKKSPSKLWLLVSGLLLLYDSWPDNQWIPDMETWWRWFPSTNQESGKNRYWL